MKTIGFIIPHKENENRRALVPAHLAQLKYTNMLYVETGYGRVLGYTDQDYANYGINIVERDVAMACDIICDPKVGDADYFDKLKPGQTIFGWVHAVQNRDITDSIVNGKLTAIAWEDMFDRGLHLFWRNNEIAGEAAIMHAFSLHGIFPYDTKVALLGRGNVARGAYRILVSLGADVTVFDRRTEQLLRDRLPEFDVVVNGILWDTTRRDHIIYRDDLKRMKSGALLIDISCDAHGGIETSIPTTIENPTYVEEGILHYVVDHTPSLFYKTVSRSLSEVVAQFLDTLVVGADDIVLSKALIIKDGEIIDQRINQFQNR